MCSSILFCTVPCHNVLFSGRTRDLSTSSKEIVEHNQYVRIPRQHPLLFMSSIRSGHVKKLFLANLCYCRNASIQNAQKNHRQNFGSSHLCSPSLVRSPRALLCATVSCLPLLPSMPSHQTPCPIGPSRSLVVVKKPARFHHSHSHAPVSDLFGD